MFNKLFFGVLAFLLWIALLWGASYPAADRVDREKSRPQKEPKIVLKEMDDIEGYYTCKGSEGIGGKNYGGIAVITKKSGIYVVTWVIGGASTFTGVGVRQGDVLAVSWAISIEKGFIKGVNLYRIEAGPCLTGIWATSPGPGVPQRETLTFLKNIGPEDE